MENKPKSESSVAGWVILAAIALVCWGIHAWSKSNPKPFSSQYERDSYYRQQDENDNALESMIPP